MSSDEKGGNQGVTIVGGRPMHRAVDVTLLPIGLEQALTIAALNPWFKRAFSKDPFGAAASRSIKLDKVETMLLASKSPKELGKMVDRMVIPKTMKRRAFVKSVAASVVAMVSGSAHLLCSGCTGADRWDSQEGIVGEALQRWENLVGYTCYVYVPGWIVTEPSDRHPLLLCLHDEGEDCLSNIQRWQATADAYGFHLVSVNWDPSTSTRERLAADLASIRLSYIHTHYNDPDASYLCSRGAATEVAWLALNEPGSPWNGAAFLGGLPSGDSSLDVVPQASRIYYVIGTEDDAYEGAQAFGQVASVTLPLELVVVEGSTDEAILSFETIWRWLNEGDS